jgi:hypothetical protein
MFNLNRSSEQQLVAGLGQCTGYGYRGLRSDRHFSAGTNSPAQGLNSADLFRRCVSGCKRNDDKIRGDPECLAYHLFFCFYR